MRLLLKIVSKIPGIQKLWGVFNGSKTYLGAAALILSGAGQLVAHLAAVSDLAGLYAFVQALPTDPGLAALGAGLAALGLRHAVAKGK